MNLLLDTCVVIDYLGRKEPFYAEAERVMAAGFFGDARLWIAGQTINDAFYVLSKYLDPRRVQAALETLLQVVSPVVLSPTDYTNALRLGWDDLEDCLVALCAQSARADYLVTRDAKGFSRSPKGFSRSLVPVVSPSEWLVLMEQRHALRFEGVGV